mmetsp:Transcript_4540/g.12662  ORF Transcript_4540/g.12662 Transcript_4540/m.12662 type:complete len:123 (-) Transcript_4540:1088-1456(-)
MRCHGRAAAEPIAEPPVGGTCGLLRREVAPPQSNLQLERLSQRQEGACPATQGKPCGTAARGGGGGLQGTVATGSVDGGAARCQPALHLLHMGMEGGLPLLSLAWLGNLVESEGAKSAVPVC